MEKQIYMTPKQPFLVTSSEHYIKYVMNCFGIVHFYQCKTENAPRYAVIPDGCVNMVFCCGSSNPYAKICGTVLTLENVLLNSNTYYFGVRFLPGYNPVLGSDVMMSELINRRVPFEALINDRRMVEGILGTTDFRRQISIFMKSYMSIYNRVCPEENRSLLVLHSLNLLIRSSGSISMEQIADDTGYTMRYINKCFHNATGLSPKQFSKIVRFQAAVSALNEPLRRSLTEIADDLGYFDQAHFIRDFKQFTGLTPKKYQSIIENNEFRQKLNIIDEII
ncbi:MAG: helix-turn-helix domain-containing protein [Ruminococcus sp.]|nr:helix-turn-helix domain-containing protein [Ruminococcus sp.]